MSQKFNLSISNPCSEKFNQFKKTEAGGFCASCQKEVIDFSDMTSKEIINYFKNKESNVCGSFKSTQLKTYTTDALGKNHKFSFMGGLSLSLLTLSLMNTAQAQTTKQPTVIIEKDTVPSTNNTLQEKQYTISGIVSDDSGPIPGANILLQGTVAGTITDFDGQFTFPQKLKKGDVLIISFIGFETKKITISDNQKKLNFDMKIDLKMDSCMLMGEVEVKKVFKSKKSLWRKLKL